jgi:hypothetical protein
MSTAGLLFVGGVAAAATGTNPLSPLLNASEDAGPALTTTTTTTIGTTTTTGAPLAATALDTDAVCAEAANHGEAVSTVAKDKSTVGAEHGAAVSKMAQSDCGKVAVDDETDDQTEPQPEPEDELTFEQICEAAENHGEAVSTVAKDKSTVGAEHGAAVSKMAQSDCGKSDANDDDDDDSDEERDAPAAASKSSKKKTGESGAPQGS